MEQQIRDRYHEAVLQAAMQRYGIASDRIRPLDAFENFVYEFERGSRGSRGSHAYILRIAHSLRRSEALIQGEVDWINHLAARGVFVASAIRSEAGRLVEAIDDGQGGHFLVTAFVKAQGRPPWEVGWTPALYETYGGLLGSMHALARQYQPGEPAWKRPDWDDDIMEFVQRYLPASETVVLHKYHALCEYLHTLPKENASYGLVHYDAHASNLFVDGAGRITLFDFDECAYSWFINDIAIVLFYIVTDAQDAPAFTREFMAHFWAGYRQAHPLAPRWLKEMPHFLKLREMELYAVMHRDFDVSNIDDAWCARFMRDRKYKLEHDVPYVDVDFESLLAH